MTLLLKILKATANEKRIKILEILSEKKRIDLTSLSKLLHTSTSLACQHIKKLETVYMVNHETKNRKAIYSLNPKRPLRFNKQILKLLKKQRKRFL